VVAIKKHGEIIAYGLNLIGDEEYFGVAEGLDYDVRDLYDLYANSIFEGLRVACGLGKKTFNIGITSYDFKTSIGAELDPSVYFVKAFKMPDYSAVYADFIQKNIKQPENHHRVFRDCNALSRLQTSDAEAMLRRPDDPLDPFAKHLRYIRVDAVRAANLYTYCPVFESAQEPIIRHKGRDVIMLGTNSYLGLATHPKVKDAAMKAIDKYGSGCSGSPLLNGTLDIHIQLAFELAQFMNKQDALIFSTGYQTNVGVISALVNRDDVLIMDERNHASLIDGAILSRAMLVRYKHNDIESLEAVMRKYVDKPKLVVIDSLFSMEGTIIDLPKIVQLVRQYHARLMLDESHAIGVVGTTGRGVAEYYGLLNEVDIIMGTFSKSLASIGGFVAGDRKILDTLRHTARSHIFSASLPPSSVAAVLAAIKIIDEEPERRAHVLENARFLAEGLRNLGYKISHHGSAIISLFCGHELLTVAAFHKLFDEGIFVNPITYPAVPKNQEMLRISLMATHDKSMLLRALDVFKCLKTMNWPDRVEDKYSIKEVCHVN
jgi:8-amino-7-oxononanoate synthase